MTEWEKIIAALEELTERKISHFNRAPLAYRIAWRLGWRPPPPLFQSFKEILLFQGIGAGGFFLLFMWIAFFLKFPLASWKLYCLLIPALSLLIGLAIGLGGAISFRWRAKQMGLPPWKDYWPKITEDRNGQIDGPRVRNKAE